MSGAAAGAAAAAAAATAQAIRASGVVIQVETAEFMAVIGRQSEPLIVHATGGILSTTYQYLTSYKGLAFYCKSSTPITLPKDAELIRAGAIWVPG